MSPSRRIVKFCLPLATTANDIIIRMFSHIAHVNDHALEL